MNFKVLIINVHLAYKNIFVYVTGTLLPYRYLVPLEQTNSRSNKYLDFYKIGFLCFRKRIINPESEIDIWAQLVGFLKS